MKNKTEITVLGFKGSSDSFWTSPPSHISYKNYSDFISPENQELPKSIAIHGHSTSGGTLEEKTPAEIAEELSRKYAHNQNQLEQICLLACSVSQSQNNQPSFAQSLANELYIRGFDKVIIHAPPPVKENFESRMVINEGFKLGASITYYVVPNSEIAEFDVVKKIILSGRIKGKYLALRLVFLIHSYPRLTNIAYLKLYSLKEILMIFFQRYGRDFMIFSLTLVVLYKLKIKKLN